MKLQLQVINSVMGNFTVNCISNRQDFRYKSYQELVNLKHHSLISLNGLFALSLKQAFQGGPIPFFSNSRPTLFPMLYVFAKVDCMPLCSVKPVSSVVQLPC